MKLGGTVRAIKKMTHNDNRCRIVFLSIDVYLFDLQGQEGEEKVGQICFPYDTWMLMTQGVLCVT